MLINIQFLRFIAAMLVVVHHMAAHVRASGHEPGLLFSLGQSAGFAGVDIFFVISGYIMMWTTAEAAGGAAALSFIKRRVARIYSGYWPFYLLALVLFTMLGGNQPAHAQLLRSFLLWPTELRHLLIPVSWTLIFEMYFYLLFALLISIRSVSRILLIGALGVIMLCWAVFTNFVRHAYDPGRLESMSLYEQYLAFPYLLEFLCGALLAGWLRVRPRGPAWIWLTAGAGLFVAGGWINTMHFQGRLIEGYYIIWRVLVFGSAALAIVAGMVRLENQGWSFGLRFSLLAGGASYALYLSHTLILWAAHRMGFDAWVSRIHGWPAYLLFCCLAAIIVAYSMLHYRCLERPLHHAFRRWLRC